MIMDHLSGNTLAALTKHWASEKTGRGKLARDYQALINGRDSDIDGRGIYALIRFAGAELGIVPAPKYA